MILLDSLEIFNFRNLRHVNIIPKQHVNIFYGCNGSGKTSLLEAIYHLSLGRSFRTHNSKHVIKHGEKKLVVFGRISGVSTGIEKSYNGAIKIKIDHQNVRTAAKLADKLPIQLLNQDSYKLVVSGPSARRQFIDWGVFHANSVFFDIWKQVRRIIKQRNIALRRNLDVKEICLWDKCLVPKALELTKLREDYINQFVPIFLKKLKKFADISDITANFYKGWCQKTSLFKVLQESVPQDRQRGYTNYGPQRSDLQIFIKNRPIQEVLSRGQQKLVVYTMHLTQAELLRQIKRKNSIFLIDDLYSEIDECKSTLFCKLLSSLNMQVFITNICNSGFASVFNDIDYKLFHVKQGAVFECDCSAKNIA